jgi:hypothetical protein
MQSYWDTDASARAQQAPARRSARPEEGEPPREGGEGCQRGAVRSVSWSLGTVVGGDIYDFRQVLGELGATCRFPAPLCHFDSSPSASDEMTRS